MPTVSIVGSTGSIGTQTAEVVLGSDGTHQVAALAAGTSVDLVVEQVGQLRPQFVAMATPQAASSVQEQVDRSVEVSGGPEAVAEAARRAEVCINGVVGFAGLGATLAALSAGRRLGLANKESLIAAGPVVQQARRTPGAELVPVDSEHAALHQCLRAAGEGSPVRSLQLTASGGPFRGWGVDRLQAITVEDALAHPTWSMGPKITVDSSTLMNKGLEVIEAHELYGTPAGEAGVGLGLDAIDVVVHPQSIVHSMVTFSDGTTMAQLSRPDMRNPIGYALSYPSRLEAPYGRLDWSKTLTLEFEPPDRTAFPCLGLAFDAAGIGGTAPAWLSAANEVAVDAFLKGRIRWVDIAGVVADVLDAHDGDPGTTLEAILEGDGRARDLATAVIERR